MTAHTDALPSVAGIRIVHVVDAPIRLTPTQRPDWPSGSGGEPLIIRHRVGDTTPRGLDAVFEIAPWSTYYLDGSGATSVRFHSVDGSDPARLMRSVRPGYEYVVEYDFAPATPTSRRASELAAFALALAIRGRGLLAHGSALVLQSGVGALCLGVSGAGKSTLARMMLEREGVAVLNDDRQVISPGPEGLHLWSTPWPGSADIAFPGDAPLGAVVLIGRAERGTARRVTPREAVNRLFATLAIPHWGGEALDSAIALVDRVITEVPVVELAYPLGPDTPDWILEQISAIACEHSRA
ncbi:MAG TPA: hypothetical protein VHM30_19145 [Gemmatimonadaceae bacterium]|nr:hypothetical protein [Gemmatimonadaceae bacterium]